MALSLPFSESTINVRGQYGPRLWNGSQTFHTGVDFAIAGGVNVPASDSGVVTKVEYTSLKGYQVEIRHGNVAKTRYHMLDADVPVRAGDTVSKGQTIGKVASRRYSSSAAWTGPHLHFEIWYPFTGGSNPQFTHMNPLSFIRGQSSPAGGSGTPIGPEPTDPIAPTPTPEPPKPKERHMYAIHDTDTGHRFTIGCQFIRHESSAPDAAVTTSIVNPTGQVHELSTYQLRRFLISCGVDPKYVDPNLIPANTGGRWWSREWEIERVVNNINNRG